MSALTFTPASSPCSSVNAEGLITTSSSSNPRFGAKDLWPSIEVPVFELVPCSFSVKLESGIAPSITGSDGPDTVEGVAGRSTGAISSSPSSFSLTFVLEEAADASSPSEESSGAEVIVSSGCPLTPSGAFEILLDVRQRFREGWPSEFDVELSIRFRMNFVQISLLRFCLLEGRPEGLV